MELKKFEEFARIANHDLRGLISRLGSHFDDIQKLPLSEKERSAICEEGICLTEKILKSFAALVEFSSQNEPKIRTVRADKPIENAIDLLSLNARKKNILLIAPTSGLFVRADSIMLEIVIRNLVANAIKFTPEGGEVRISTETSDGKTTISVADNGIGLPYELQNEDNLFGTSNTKVREGTNGEKGFGIGLATCKKYVEAMGGEIHLAPILEPVHAELVHDYMNDFKPRGTEFHISLPAE